MVFSRPTISPFPLILQDVDRLILQQFFTSLHFEKKNLQLCVLYFMRAFLLCHSVTLKVSEVDKVMKKLSCFPKFYMQYIYENQQHHWNHWYSIMVTLIFLYFVTPWQSLRNENCRHGVTSLSQSDTYVLFLQKK